MGARFIHLHLHTEYSLVDSIVRVKPLATAVAKAGMPACAVTDQGNLFAMVKFYRAAVVAGVKPIVGADLWLHNAASRTQPYRLTLLAQNLAGYHGLTRLISRGYLEGQHGDVPVIDWAWLEAAQEGLIALSGAREGDIGQALIAGRTDEAARRLEAWRGLFGDRFYLELQRTGRPGDEAHVHACVRLALEQGAAVVATNDVRFLKAEDFEAHEAKVCIQEGRTLEDPRRPRRYSEQQYLRTPEEMAELFADLPEALENSVEIARRCSVELELGKSYLPEFPIPAGLSTQAYFSQQARTGLEQRLQRLLPEDTPDRESRCAPYRERLERELGVIVQMGFPGYFLIVADFIRWARDSHIPVGPGRGSGAGSLVAYALGITDLDPLAYDLLFERFLNPERVSMPDFDLDFCMEGRDRVIDYVAGRYGRDRVSQIATHGSMAAKAVVRDVGRVLGHPYGFVDRIAKLIPFQIGMTLDKALAEEEEFRRVYDAEEDVRAVVDLARRLEGLARNVGKHAGGVVIAPSVLTDFTPLYCEPGGGSVVTQFDKDDVEAVGLVKFDFLGLRTLTIIDWAVQTINEERLRLGERPLDMTALPMDDAAAFDLLKSCQTTAVFQLESRGMKDLIKRLRPDCFEDIVALVALYRPGPLQSGMVEDFINRKHGRAAVAYPHVALESILKPTYGVILYQEQVMQIAQVLADYTLGGADLLRRAMGKKKAEEMAKQRAVFMEGAQARGVSDGTASHIFDLMEKFAGYGFNKSHSAAYALLSYHTAWLKAHHPAAFMAAVLSSDMDNTDKVVTLIDDCQLMGLRVLPPEINRSGYRFTVADPRTILYGLGAIKGAGHGAIEVMLAERAARGPFGDLFDLCRRIDLHKANRRVLEAMVRGGALDGLGPNRATLMAWLPQALQAAEQYTRDASSGQDDLFGLHSAPAREASPRSPALPEWEEEERLGGERDTLGLYLSGHPIEQYREELARFTKGRIKDLVAGVESSEPGQRRFQDRNVVLAGLAVSVRVRKGQSGRFAILTLDDRSGRVDMRVLSEPYERFRHLLVKDRVLVVEGPLGYDDYSGGYRIDARQVMDIEGARETYAKRLRIDLDARLAADGLVERLAEVLAPYREGPCGVWVRYCGPQAEAELRFGASWGVRPTDKLLQQLRGLVGADRVGVQY